MQLQVVFNALEKSEILLFSITWQFICGVSICLSHQMFDLESTIHQIVSDSHFKKLYLKNMQ